MSDFFFPFFSLLFFITYLRQIGYDSYDIIHGLYHTPQELYLLKSDDIVSNFRR